MIRKLKVIILSLVVIDLVCLTLAETGMFQLCSPTLLMVLLGASCYMLTFALCENIWRSKK